MIHEGIGEKVANGIQFLATFIFGFTLGFARGWELTLFVLGCSPFLMGAGAFMMKVLSDLSTAGQKAYAIAGAIATEVLSGIKTVASFSAEPREVERYSINLRDARKIGDKRGFFTGLGMGLTFMIFFFTYGAALYFGGFLIKERVST